MAEVKLPTMLLCADATSAAQSAAEVVRGAASRALEAQGAFRWALAGGSTPKALYGWLAELGPDFLPWDRVALYWGDERVVPKDDAASNYRMVREALLDHIAVGEVHRIETELGAEAAAARYAAALPERLDLVLLGMGDDGHTASLFPDTPALDADEPVVVTDSPVPPRARISLTLRAINAARDVAVLVTGAGKAQRLAQAYRELVSQKPRLPIARVSPAERYLWIVDEAAAAELPQPLSPEQKGVA